MGKTVIIMATLLVCAAANAAILSSNLTNTSGGSTNYDGLYLAQGFTTGSSGATVTTIVAHIVDLYNGYVADSIDIYDDDSGIPGSSLGTFTVASLGLGDVNFTNAGGVSLSANTNYWVVDTNTDFRWSYTNDLSQTGWDIGPSHYWSSSPPYWIESSGNPLMMELQSAPEPLSILFMALGGMMIRKRK